MNIDQEKLAETMIKKMMGERDGELSETVERMRNTRKSQKSSIPSTIYKKKRREDNEDKE